MNCPKCNQAKFYPQTGCEVCQFSADPLLLDELNHIDWLLAEIQTWGGEELKIQISEKYQARKQQIEIELELRLPPFSAAEAPDAWMRLFQIEVLEKKLKKWLWQDALKPGIFQQLDDQLKIQNNEFHERLAGQQKPEIPDHDVFRLDTINFILDTIEGWNPKELFDSATSQKEALQPLFDERENLEIRLGLRKPPEIIQEETLAPVFEPPVEKVIQPSIPEKPKLPLRERFWRSLLSERTLHAILFLGIFLLFSAAVSFVVWGWKEFPAIIRVAIPSGFTTLFFFLGWVVRTKTNLYRSGIALSAIASLLIPIDLYTVYANYGSPPTFWAEFWLITSIICFGAYLISTLKIQSGFFGYLVGVAAGSSVLAGIALGHQAGWISRDFSSAGISILALGMVLISSGLERAKTLDRWQILVDPFRYLALLAVGVIMPLTFGWRYLDRLSFDALHSALTVNWWIGGLIFGWGAVRYHSRALGILAAGSLPVAVYLTQAAVFSHLNLNPAWHAFGLAGLVPLYWGLGHHFTKDWQEVITISQGRTANRWGVALFLFSAMWSLTNLTSGASAASTHFVLAGAVILATILWKRPNFLFGAALLIFSATTFTMTEIGLSIQQFGVGWASLAILFILCALIMGNRFSRPIIFSGYILAALAIFPALFPYDGDRLLYSLGNWIGLAAWGAYLSHREHPGLVEIPKWMRMAFHWLAALPLPIWIYFINRRPADSSLFLGLAALSWGLLGLSYWLTRIQKKYRTPWYFTSFIVSVAATIAAFFIVPDGFTPALCLLSAGFLYFGDAFTSKHSLELLPAGVVTAWGFSLLLYKFNFHAEPRYFFLALLIALYFFGGLWLERTRSKIYTSKFLSPLYIVGHFLSIFVILWASYRLLDAELGSLDLTDAMKIWGAAAFFLLGTGYIVYAWGRNQVRWGHIGIWLATVGFAILAILLSTGSGRSAVVAALVAIAYIFIERGLNRFRSQFTLTRRQRAYIRIGWRLYRIPLLFAGWMVSLGAMGLALVRNLLLLEGGRPQQIWAIASLLLVTALYAFSAKLFKRRRYVWYAAILSFAPWTILTNLGWFTSYRLTTAGFAVSWMVLAWVLFLIGLWVENSAAKPYALPLKVVANLLIPFSLLWGIADPETSRYTFGLGFGLYAFGAGLGYRRAKYQNDPLTSFAISKYLYPALGLIPIWLVYWFNLWFPAARHEIYGLLFLGFAALGLLAGQELAQISPRAEIKAGYALPGYLVGYLCLIIGLMLVAHIPVLLCIALLYAAALLLFSAKIFENPLWLYPAVVLIPISLLISLSENGIALNRQGLWLISLAAIYLTLGWLFCRINLPAYSTSVLTVGFALIAFGLPPSSQDQVGALWGFGAAALLYAISAFWLKQPLFLTSASALVIVPYAVGIHRSALSPDFYGLALIPGAVLALVIGWVLDKQYGDYTAFPWGNPLRWPKAFIDRLLSWWALPLYALGFGLAFFSPIFTNGRADLTALNFLLLVYPLVWAVRRFRLRVWLVAAILAGHLSMGFYLKSLGWWQYPAHAFLRFMPITLLSLIFGLWIAHRRGEDSPLNLATLFKGWSRPFYFFLLVDILVAQIATFNHADAGDLISLIHALIFALLAYLWLDRFLPYLVALLGVVALGQWLTTLGGSIEGLSFAYSLLAMGYGVLGFGIEFGRKLVKNSAAFTDKRWPRILVFQAPFQFSGIFISVIVMGLTFVLGIDLVNWTVRAIFGLAFRDIVSLTTILMFVRVFSVVGLLYMSAAVVKQKSRLGYLAGVLLLTGWLIYAFYIQQWEQLTRLQWYAIPAGLYLLIIAYFEWQQGNKKWSRWLDYAGLVLMFGSLFWQTMILGWKFALLLGFEGLISLWWGSARRLRRFFYAGIVAVVLATIGQLLNALQAINQWVTFGIIGLLLVAIAVLVERRMETFRTWRESLEDWE